MSKYRKKPVVIDAVQFTKAGQRQEFQSLIGGENKVSFGGDHILIETLEGIMRADLGDWIIKGVEGELYPCKPNIFAATYEPAQMTIAEEIQREAWEAFERWCREYDTDGNLGALELAEAYYQSSIEKGQ